MTNTAEQGQKYSLSQSRVGSNGKRAGGWGEIYAANRARAKTYFKVFLLSYDCVEAAETFEDSSSSSMKTEFQEKYLTVACKCLYQKPVYLSIKCVIRGMPV